MSAHQDTDHIPVPFMAESMTNSNISNGYDNGVNSHTTDDAIGGSSEIDIPFNARNGHDRGYPRVNGTANQSPGRFTSKSESNRESYEPIAIIGCGMRLPGSIDTDEALWQLLSGKQDGRCRVPLDRYNVNAFYGPGKAGHVCTEFGHFLEHVNLTEIDSSFWSMTRKEIEVMDPQQRLALEVVYECLQSSGTTDWKGKDIGVFFGIFGEDWADMQAKEPQQSGMYRISGSGDFVVANRVSYEFDFKGPSVVTRTACSSSLTALHDACLAIQRGECESAIAGGTNLIMNPHMTIAMAEQGVLSKDGQCKTFDSAANGYVRGEGVVAIHVKTLSAAIRDNDPIRAVIRSSCTNSDGRTAGMALPNSESHEALMRHSHILAGLDLRQTAMIECHGTGTQAGDPLEASAVARVFGDYGIYIGSIKPNLGHSEGASGITSVIKAMLSLEKRLILPNINFHSPNKKIPFDKYDISVPTEILPWPKGKAERIGVNSFGIGGANAHVLLESPTQYGITRSQPSESNVRSHYLLTFSAASSEALKSTIKAHGIYYQNHSDRLADLSYTLTVRRQPLEQRAFCIVASGADPNEPLQISPFESSRETRLATFFFTGQGAQYAQMAADLLCTNVVFQTSVASMEKVLSECDPPPTWSLREELLKNSEETNLARAEFSQSCCTALQVALVDVLQSWGVKPTAVVGHSSGEIAAAYASDVLSAADAIKVAYYRGIVSKSVTTNGGMIAVGLSCSQVKPHLRPGVIIGCENGPSSTTLSGDSNMLQKVVDSIRVEYPEALVRHLRVDCAYHSHHMKPVSSSYAAFLSRIQAKRPTIPFYSSVTGEKVLSATLDASYWVSNLTSPVLFYQAASQLLSDFPEAVLLEVGPHSALAGPLRQTIKATNSEKAKYVSTLIRNENASAAILSSVGTLFQHGVPVRFDHVVPKGNVLTDLPKYAWHRQGPYWNESRLSQGWRQREFPKHDVLGARVVEASEYNPTWRCLLNLDDVPWIRDHDISHDIVFPGAGYVAMAGEAIRQLTGEIDFTVREVTISNALVLVEGATTEVITHFKPVRLTIALDSTWYDFEITSYNSSNGRWIKHAVGQARGGCNYKINPPKIGSEKRMVESPKWYSVMKRFGLNYGPRFMGMRKITAGVSERRAVAYIDNISEDWESFYTMHPCTIDFAFQLFSVAAFKGLSRLFTQLSVPTYIGELYLQPTVSEMLVAVDAELTARGAFFGDAVGTSPDIGTVFRLKSLKMSPLTDSSDVRGNDPHAAAELVWKPDVNLLDLRDLMHVTKHFGGLILMVERMALACIIESSLLLAKRDIDDEFLSRFRTWLDKVYHAALKGDYEPVKDDSHIAEMTSTERLSMIESLHRGALQTDAWPISTAVYRIFHAIEGIAAGTTEALQVLLEGDLLARVYDFQRLSNFDEFFQLVSHQKPDLRILEVGAGTGNATAEILPALSSLKPYHDRNYLSYTFTDVSPGFFENAKQRFKDYDAIEYRVLDITKDPVDQGFEEGSFDIIVASNVLHATPNLVQTLTHCRKLLTTEGWLFLQELSPPGKWINYVMGVLPGWWLGESDGRIEEPYLSPQQWEPYLNAAGFNGIQSVHHDEQLNATMVSRPTKQLSTKRVTILAKDLSLNYVAEISSELQLEYQIDCCAWGDKCPEGQDIVAILDLEAPFMHNIDDALFSQFKCFLLKLKQNGNGILWVTGNAQNNCSDPRYGVFLGFARTLRTELELHLGILELDSFEKSAWKSIPKVFSRFQGRAFTEISSKKPDMEWAFVKGEILTPRFHWISVNQALAAPQLKEQAQKLEIQKRGILSSLYWKQYTPAEPQGDYIRIRNHAVGLNFKDVLISMGVVEGTVIEGDGLGSESAGIVEKVGPEVKNLAVGDRCIVFASGAFATSVTTSEKVCVKIPDSLSFTDAASMATVYCTAIYSVVDKARLEKGQTILIHSACGGVGIAAIQVCRALGAEIYCTVGSEEKVEWLMKNYHIARDHIFNSRDQTFQRDVLEATAGRGVDVVLNSLSGELLHASWQCVAEFGCMVEIGKRDLINKGSLALDLFERNRSFFGVDFAQICGQKPDVASRLLKKMMEMFKRGDIGPIHPITEFPASQIEESMRFMQKGSHIGKVVVSLPETAKLPSKTGKEVFQLRKNASYLLAGGLGGLGQAVAVWMAEAGATELIFLSRSARAEETCSNFVAELEGLGCKAIIIQGSVINENDVEKSMRAATKPLAGILQASMILHDVAFPSMSFEDWKRVIEPKVKGTWNLHNLSVNFGLNLDFFLLFSSWSGLFGQWGQANYAAGNSFLDSFAQYRRNMGLAASTVDIGIMEDIGYVSRNAHVLEHFRTTSTHVLHEQDLLDSLHLMINRGAPKSTEKCQLAIGLRSTQPLSAPNNRTIWRKDPRMSLYFNTERHVSATVSTNSDELRQFLVDAAEDIAILDNKESTKYIATEIGKTLFAFLMRDVKSLDITDSFSALGVDSLVSIELRNWFKQRLGCEITVLDILGSSSILELGQHTATLLKTKMTSLKSC